MGRQLSFQERAGLEKGHVGRGLAEGEEGSRHSLGVVQAEAQPLSRCPKVQGTGRILVWLVRSTQHTAGGEG